MNEQLTTLFLTQEDIKLFVEFQKRYVLKKLLESLGVFDIKSGNVEIHFTSSGEIGSVDIHKHYKI